MNAKRALNRWSAIFLALGITVLTFAILGSFTIAVLSITPWSDLWDNSGGFKQQFWGNVVVFLIGIPVLGGPIVGIVGIPIAVGLGRFSLTGFGARLGVWSQLIAGVIAGSAIFWLMEFPSWFTLGPECGVAALLGTVAQRAILRARVRT